MDLTEVVFTPQSSNFSNVGVAALGVSMNSNSLSEPLTLWDLAAMIVSAQARSWRANLLISARGEELSFSREMRR
jgi:hypothetical protein